MYWPSACIFFLGFFFGRPTSPLGLSFFFWPAGQSAETEIFFPGGRGKKEPPPSAVETRWQPGAWLLKPRTQLWCL
jgi:hypothetical protein